LQAPTFEKRPFFRFIQEMSIPVTARIGQLLWEVRENGSNLCDAGTRLRMKPPTARLGPFTLEVRPLNETSVLVDFTGPPVD